MKKADWSALYAGRSGWRRARDRFEYGALRSWERDMFQVLCARVPEGGSVLSVGCGRALLDYWLVRVWGAEVHLLDLSQSCLDKVSRSFADVPHETYCHDALELPFEDDRFDLVWNAGVWEHFAEDEIYRGIAEMCRTSKGHVVASVPYAGCKPYLRAKEWLEKHDQWDYGFEDPKETLRPYFEAAGAELLEERLIGSQQTCWNYLGMIRDEAAREEVAASLEPEDFDVFPHILAVARIG